LLTTSVISRAETGTTLRFCFFASSRNAGSASVASNAARNAARRSAGTPGGATNGRPMAARAKNNSSARRHSAEPASITIGAPLDARIGRSACNSTLMAGAREISRERSWQADALHLVAPIAS
jgi:hypothetical protein